MGKIIVDTDIKENTVIVKTANSSLLLAIKFDDLNNSKTDNPCRECGLKYVCDRYELRGFRYIGGTFTDDFGVICTRIKDGKIPQMDPSRFDKILRRMRGMIIKKDMRRLDGEK